MTINYKQDAYSILLEANENANKEIMQLREKEIVYLKNLIDKDIKIKALIKIIAELKCGNEKNDNT